MKKLSEVKPFKTKSEVVYEFLKSNILGGTFKPGEKIIIRNIAKRLKVSDIPVREAIKKLEMQGLIHVNPHVGASIIKSNRKEIEGIFIIRSELESLATRLASKYMKKENFHKLRRIIKECKEAIRQGKIEQYGEFNKKFHMEIYKCSPYKLLVKMISHLWERSRMARVVFTLSNERLSQSQKEHKLILEALMKGNGDLAGEIVRRQKIASWNVILKSIEE